MDRPDRVPVPRPGAPGYPTRVTVRESGPGVGYEPVAYKPTCLTVTVGLGGEAPTLPRAADLDCDPTGFTPWARTWNTGPASDRPVRSADGGRQNQNLLEDHL